MNKEKQIERLVDLIDDYIEQVDVKRWYSDELDEGLAEHLYEAGYREQSEWVSVDERLPKKYTRVLVRYNSEVCISFINGNGTWFDCLNHLVTHWMPLPGAPEMKGGK